MWDKVEVFTTLHSSMTLTFVTSLCVEICCRKSSNQYAASRFSSGNSSMVCWRACTCSSSGRTERQKDSACTHTMWKGNMQAIQPRGTMRIVWLVATGQGPTARLLGRWGMIETETQPSWLDARQGARRPRSGRDMKGASKNTWCTWQFTYMQRWALAFRQYETWTVDLVYPGRTPWWHTQCRVLALRQSRAPPLRCLLSSSTLVCA